MPMNRRHVALTLAAGVLAASAVTTTVRMVQEVKSETQTQTETAGVTASPDHRHDHPRSDRRQTQRETRIQTMRVLVEEGVVTEDTPRKEARRLIRERIKRDREMGWAY